MKSQLKLAISLFIVTAAALVAPAVAQTSPIVDKPRGQPDLALTYSYIRSNAPPAQCGCFSLNGGSAAFAWPIKSNGFAVMGDVTAATTSNGSTSVTGLTLKLYLRRRHTLQAARRSLCVEAVWAGSGGGRALQRAPRPGPEFCGDQCKCCLCRSNRRRA